MGILQHESHQTRLRKGKFSWNTKGVDLMDIINIFNLSLSCLILFLAVLFILTYEILTRTKRKQNKQPTTKECNHYIEDALALKEDWEEEQDEEDFMLFEELEDF